ncbi:MAG: peptidase M64 [Candidatus Aminicenantes bacterium]|nr:peptidase M64 [Candidatus Aminicenantes bacterium]
MKKYTIMVLLLLGCFCACHSQTVANFSNHFINQTMRIDYYHVGDQKEEFITIDKIYRQGTWAGNPNHLLDTFNLGRYQIKVYEKDSQTLIFSKGFDSYFGEYKTTTPAASGIKRTYHETALIPYPKRKIKFVIEKRDRQNRLHPIFETVIAPRGIEINREPLSGDVKVFEILKNGAPHNKVDVAFIAEGYTRAEEGKFKKRLETAAENFFKIEPYKTNKDKFNIYGVFKPSQESGCDEPGHGIYRNTAVHSSFNALGSPRYLLTEGNKELRDIAAHAPYDTLLIMVNSKRYGGGGLYNSFCVFTAGSTHQQYLLVHEFGHSFTGLADEYYSSSVAYNEFYPRGIEPLEANITALLDPAEIKWKHLLSKGIEIPTKWKKTVYEKKSMQYQVTRRKLNKEIARLKRRGGPEEEIAKLKEEAERRSRENIQQTGAFLNKSSLSGKVGAFEGAGYTAKGLYRPMLNCIMFSRGIQPYCKVCRAAVARVIEFYTD